MPSHPLKLGGFILPAHKIVLQKTSDFLLSFVGRLKNSWLRCKLWPSLCSPQRGVPGDHLQEDSCTTCLATKNQTRLIMIWRYGSTQSPRNSGIKIANCIKIN